MAADLFATSLWEHVGMRHMDPTVNSNVAKHNQKRSGVNVKIIR